MLDSPRTVHLRGGTTALRPIRAEHAPALTRLYDRLSSESAYQRFFAVMRRLPPDWARILADVDHDRRAAIVALGPAGELVGVARDSALADPGEAEIALVVQDAWQGRGWGRSSSRRFSIMARTAGLPASWRTCWRTIVG